MYISIYANSNNELINTTRVMKMENELLKNFVSDFFEGRASLNIQEFIAEGIPFDIMPLSAGLIDDIKACLTYSEMLKLAAKNGILVNRVLVVEDEEKSKDIDALWAAISKITDCDPCVEYLVGEKVCIISGLKDLIAEQLEKERVIDGDGLDDDILDTDLGTLTADRTHAA